jgi:8-oxo-dGTP pyrophosphatase MutT (NUDIX family)
MNTKKAVCVLIRNGNKLLLASRRNNDQKWGLPGGKVDDGEFYRDAARRELKEETGIDLPNSRFDPIFMSYCGEYEVMTYEIKYDGFNIPALKAQVEQGITIKWGTVDEALAGPFGYYNNDLLFGQ